MVCASSLVLFKYTNDPEGAAQLLFALTVQESHLWRPSEKVCQHGAWIFGAPMN
jgi:hypothetical protein